MRISNIQFATVIEQLKKFSIWSYEQVSYCIFPGLRRCSLYGSSIMYGTDGRRATNPLWFAETVRSYINKNIELQALHYECNGNELK